MKHDYLWIWITILILISGCTSTPVKQSAALNGNYDQLTYTSPGKWFTINFDNNFQVATIKDVIEDQKSLFLDFYDTEKNHFQINAEYDRSLKESFAALKNAIINGNSSKQILTATNGIGYLYSGTSIKKHPRFNLHYGRAVLELYYNEIHYKFTLETQNCSSTEEIELIMNDICKKIINHITYNIHLDH